MSSWVLLAFIFFAWFVQLVAALFQKDVEGARHGLPKGQRGGVSCLPVIPVLPLALWGIALLINLAADPWGTWIVAAAHALIILVATWSIARCWWQLRSLNRDVSSR